MKPVIRCSVAAWIGLLMLLIYDVEATLGQAVSLDCTSKVTQRRSSHLTTSHIYSILLL